MAINLRQFKTYNQHFWQTNRHCHTGILKWFGILECQWANEKHTKCKYMYTFGEVWFNNSGDPFGYFGTNIKKCAKIGMSG